MECRVQRDSQVQKVPRVNQENQEKMELQGRREKPGFQEHEAQKDRLEKDNLAPRVMKERKEAKEIKDRWDFQDLQGQRVNRAL